MTLRDLAVRRLIQLTTSALRSPLRSRGFDLVRLQPDLTLGSFLHHLFTRLNIECVLDVGAHHGEYGRYLRRHGYRGLIISFEPVQEHYDHLVQIASRDPNWKVYKLALSNTNDATSINVARNDSGCSSFLLPTDYGIGATQGRIAVDHTQVVQTVRLDEVFDEIVGTRRDRATYLKIDTQGWDLHVLEGAVGCLDKIAALQSELSIKPIYQDMTTYQDSLKYMNQLGFEISAVFPVTRDHLLRLIEMDCVMVRSAPSRNLVSPTHDVAVPRLNDVAVSSAR